MIFVALLILFIIFILCAGYLVLKLRESGDRLAVVFIGPAGAGKGTQAKILSEKIGYPHISTGDLCRKEKASGTELGRRIAACIDRGQLISDSMALEMVCKRLDSADCNNGFILDGYPRTRNQAYYLNNVLAQENLKLFIIIFSLPEEKVRERLVHRGREDDTPEIIKERLKIYRKNLSSLLEFYCGNLALVKHVETIEADAPIDLVADMIEKSFKIHGYLK